MDELMVPSQKPKLLQLVRNKIRAMNYSLQTERNYIYWIKHFIYFHKLKHPKKNGREGNQSVFNPFRSVASSLSEYSLRAAL
jgi:hypothetical protein